jgi:hypothetical protein
MFDMKNRFYLILMTILLSSCEIQYGMIDGSIDAETFSVAQFEELAPNAPAGYGAIYTDFLKDYLISRTKLNLKNSDADIEIIGKITDFNTSPISVQSNEAAALNRLTITLMVTAINNKNEDQSFEASFTQFSDYNSDQDLSSVQDALIDDINDKLSQDIVNRLTSNW